MEIVPWIMMSFQGLLLGVSAIIVIYLIFKRINSRGNEGFEERDN